MKKIIITLIILGITAALLITVMGKKESNSIQNNNNNNDSQALNIQITNGIIPLVKVNRINGYSESDFYIGITEVTTSQWEKVMRSKPSQVKHVSGRSDMHPIEGITWEEAAKFCNQLSQMEGRRPCYDSNFNCNSNNNGYRLPTSNEWAMACYGNMQTTYPWGNSWDSRYAVDPITKSSANWMKESRTSPVQTKKPNRLGIYDMIGNVSEWCNDPFSGRSQYRTYRGGDWSDWNKTSLKSTWKGGLDRSDSLPSIGFRVATTSAK
jgi:formylglycine-generating enzyme required for sulfatase activity